MKDIKAMSDEEGENENEAAEENADEAANGDGDGGDDEGKKKGSKKLIVMVAVLVLLLGGGAGAYFTGMLDGLLGKGGAQEFMVDEDGELVLDDHGEPIPVEGDDHAQGDDDHDKKDKKSKKKKKDDGHGKKGDGHGDGHAGGNFLEIPTMIVNLSTEDGTPRYLRLTVQLEMEDSSDVAEVEAVIPKVVDQFQTYLRELRVRDLRGSAGIYRLQMELLWRVNQAAAPVEVKDVLFQEILIQ